MKNILVSAGAGAVLLAFAGVAAADTMVSATTDLNVRAGPGPEYQVIGFLGVFHEAFPDLRLELKHLLSDHYRNAIPAG